jgi:hypothetical protein
VYSNPHTNYVSINPLITHIPPKIFTSLHFTSLQFSFYFTSLPSTFRCFIITLQSLSPHFTSFHFISPHFTSFHFTSPHFTYTYFSNLLLKTRNIQRKVSSTSPGIWFQCLMVLFTKEYFPISVLCFLALIFRS